MTIAPKLSVLIPVYNEQYFVEQLVGKVLAALRDLDISCELIVVNDCSSDGTPAILQRLAREHADAIRLFEHEINQGKGAAVRTAIQQASGDICIVQDADLEYDPNDYHKLMSVLTERPADVVYGSRFAGEPPSMALRHRVGNRLLTGLTNLLYGSTLTDMETCYKMVRTEILKSIPLESSDFCIEPELTIKLAKRGAHLFEVPISYSGRSYQDGKKINWKDGIKALLAILKFAISDRIYQQDEYGSQILARLNRAPRFTRWMADVIRPYVGHRILEIGAGIGNLTLNLIPRSLYWAIDINLNLTSLIDMVSENTCVLSRNLLITSVITKDSDTIRDNERDNPLND